MNLILERKIIIKNLFAITFYNPDIENIDRLIVYVFNKLRDVYKKKWIK